MQTITFNDNIENCESIGQGAQSIVKKCSIRNKATIVVIKKYLATNRIHDINYQAIKELNALEKLKNCQTIIKLFDVNIELSDDFSYISVNILFPFYTSDMTKYIKRTELEKRIKYFNYIFVQLMDALYHLYINGIIHMDIKPDNIFLEYKHNREPKLYLADFGFASQNICSFKYNLLHNDISGSPLYLAPELLTDHTLFNNKVDIWSSGITLLEYLTDAYITEPLDINDHNMEGIVYRILELLNPPLGKTYKNYKDVQNYKLHQHIDVENVLIEYIGKENFNLIEHKYIKYLNKMLQINPNDRINILTIYNGKKCSSNDDLLKRGRIVSKYINNEIYYIMVSKIFDVCTNFNINIYICYYSINLLECYIANFNFTNKNDFTYIPITIVIILLKFYDGINLNLNNLIKMNNNLNSININIYEQKILTQFKYIIHSCETDEFIIELEKNKDLLIKKYKDKNTVNEELYNRLFKMYKNLKDQNIYPGYISGFQLVEYF